MIYQFKFCGCFEAQFECGFGKCGLNYWKTALSALVYCAGNIVVASKEEPEW